MSSGKLISFFIQTAGIAAIPTAPSVPTLRSLRSHAGPVQSPGLGTGFPCLCSRSNCPLPQPLTPLPLSHTSSNPGTEPRPGSGGRRSHFQHSVGLLGPPGNQTWAWAVYTSAVQTGKSANPSFTGIRLLLGQK